MIIVVKFNEKQLELVETAVINIIDKLNRCPQFTAADSHGFVASRDELNSARIKFYKRIPIYFERDGISIHPLGRIQCNSKTFLELKREKHKWRPLRIHWKEDNWNIEINPFVKRHSKKEK